MHKICTPSLVSPPRVSCYVSSHVFSHTESILLPDLPPHNRRLIPACGGTFAVGIAPPFAPRLGARRALRLVTRMAGHAPENMLAIALDVPYRHGGRIFGGTEKIVTVCFERQDFGHILDKILSK